jgi:hypothetical protein
MGNFKNTLGYHLFWHFTEIALIKKTNWKIRNNEILENIFFFNKNYLVLIFSLNPINYPIHNTFNACSQQLLIEL